MQHQTNSRRPKFVSGDGGIDMRRRMRVAAAAVGRGGFVVERVGKAAPVAGTGTMATVPVRRKRSGYKSLWLDDVSKFIIECRHDWWVWVWDERKRACGWMTSPNLAYSFVSMAYVLCRTILAFLCTLRRYPNYNDRLNKKDAHPVAGYLIGQGEQENWCFYYTL